MGQGPLLYSTAINITVANSTTYPGQRGLMKLQLVPVMRTTCSDLTAHHKIVSARAIDF